MFLIINASCVFSLTTERHPAMQIPNKFIKESFSEAIFASLDPNLDSESNSGTNGRNESGSGSEKRLTSFVGDSFKSRVFFSFKECYKVN